MCARIGLQIGPIPVVGIQHVLPVKFLEIYLKIFFMGMYMIALDLNLIVINFHEWLISYPKM